MKASDPGRHKKVQEIEDAIRNGEDVDPKTGRPNQLRPDDELVELEPDDHLWLYLAGKLTAAVPPDGSLPTPSEAREVLEHGLGGAAIMHPENQLFVHEMLEWFFAGRSEGLAEKFEKPKPRGRGGRRRSPRSTPSRARRR